jgi:hypothetical protein
MRPWFSARPVDERFFETAPRRIAATFAVARPADAVWAEITSDDPLSWCRILKRIAWTSPRPLGVGTTRTAVALRGAVVLRERYFRWEEGRRHSFCVLEASAPLVRSLAEDYLVEPVSDGACRFTWTIAWEPHPATRWADAVNRRLLSTLLTDTRRHYSGA